MSDRPRLESPFPSLEQLEAATGRSRDEIVKEAVDWAVTHGLVVRYEDDKLDSNLPCFTHAPFALFPSPFPRKSFEEAKQVQKDFNTLVHKVSLNHGYLAKIVAEVASADDFTASLWKIYETVHQEGVSQPIVLGIHRSDYLLHATEQGKRPVLQQVELNTISSSFSSLSYLVGDLHRHLYSDLNLGELPQNDSFYSLADGLGKAFGLYGKPNAVVMFVVQPRERNLGDQRWIQFNLKERHNVRVIRRTLEEVAARGKLDPATKILTIDGFEVAVAYYRAGYAPTDYSTKVEWEARLTIERSVAIKCPNIGYHLAGMKKIQQDLAREGVVEQFVDPESAKRLRESFTGLYPVSKESIEMALKNPSDYVLKPQREGGGNNFYDDDIPKKLKELSDEDKKAFILMDKIKPPTVTNTLIRAGKILDTEVVSEIGIYGVFIGDGPNTVYNVEGGHLVRTKGSNVNEGGVAAGYAYLDSPVLI